uniref:Uncharacterized protein n=1 Tax=Kalanchoe fedtschenkoi TaxID=63787 RepID=A0A7N0V473_KALFE
MYTVHHSPDKFLVMSSIIVLTTISLFFHEVQGIRHSKRAPSISLEHQTTLHDEKVYLSPQTRLGGVSHEDATMEGEMVLVVTKRRRSMSSRVANNSKKPPQQLHHHWMPSIHEDYFGPRHHKPAHH